MSEQAPPLLPDDARREVLRLAAQVLGALPDADVPVPLRRIKAFTPARRPEAGSGGLSVALERDPVFRQQAAAAWRAANPELAEALDAGELPAAADPAALVAGLYLLRQPGWTALLESVTQELVRRGHDAAGVEAGDRAAGEQTGKAAAEASARAERAARERDEARANARALTEEVAVLRRDARRLRSDADRSRAAAREAQARLAAAAAMAEEAQRAHEKIVSRLEGRLAEAQDALQALRQGEREGRSLADVRLRLLLDTVLEAAAGLRRELALPPQTRSPADFLPAVVAVESAAGLSQVPSRAQASDDPAVLDALLAVPRTHLLVDGYNVTKSGYGDLPLVDQRRRLLDGLAGLLARRPLEVTCCFDGADVEATSRTWHRGVRVMFSEPGTTADDLVRRLVRAEPSGRPVVVVSSDQEVAVGVRNAGARCVPATALLRLLTRG